MNDEPRPFRIVFDKIFEINKVIKIPNNIIPKTERVDRILPAIPENRQPINKLEIVIKKGNLPVTWNKTIC